MKGRCFLLLQAWASVALLPGVSAQLDPCGLHWRRVTASNSSGQLVGRASAYDSARGVTVFFGGNNPLTGVHHRGEIWQWNGMIWARRTSMVQPPPRTDAAMAYDSERGVCVLFGGGTNIFEHEIPFNDTWEWNGANWTLRRSSDPAGGNRPPPLDGPMMAYDSHRKRVVLIGSSERDGNDIRPVERTWEWDGDSWSVHDRSTTETPAPPPRIDAAMAYVSVRKVTVVFGGVAYTGGYLDDTWIWDGTTGSVTIGGRFIPN
ncbi:MAG: hypothetical protein AB9869_36025 [Verrucomicrobiia bacterium]